MPGLRRCQEGSWSPRSQVVGPQWPTHCAGPTPACPRKEELDATGRSVTGRECLNGPARRNRLMERPSAADQRRSCPDLDVLRMSFALMLAEPVLRGYAKRYVLLFGSGLSGDVTVAVRGAEEAAAHCQPLWPSSSSLPA
jgi:hypothetical protein